MKVHDVSGKRLACARALTRRRRLRPVVVQIPSHLLRYELRPPSLHPPFVIQRAPVHGVSTWVVGAVISLSRMSISARHFVHYLLSYYFMLQSSDISALRKYRTACSHELALRCSVLVSLLYSTAPNGGDPPHMFLTNNAQSPDISHRRAALPLWHSVERGRTHSRICGGVHSPLYGFTFLLVSPRR